MANSHIILGWRVRVTNVANYDSIWGLFPNEVWQQFSVLQNGDKWSPRNNKFYWYDDDAKYMYIGFEIMDESDSMKLDSFIQEMLTNASHISKMACAIYEMAVGYAPSKEPTIMCILSE